MTMVAPVRPVAGCRSCSCSRSRTRARSTRSSRSEGAPFLAEPYAPPWGGLRFFVVDPDGYLVEIEQPGRRSMRGRRPGRRRATCAWRRSPTASSLRPATRSCASRTTGLCGADLFPFHGHTPGFEDGTILGHEFVGVVEAVGPAVHAVRAGDRVVSTSTISCGGCAHCRAGRASQCLDRALFGYSGVYQRLDGGQAELVRVPVRRPRPLPRCRSGVSDEAAVFVADMLPTGLQRGRPRRGRHGRPRRRGRLRDRRADGHPLRARASRATVIAVDGIPARRELAERFGARAVDAGRRCARPSPRRPTASAPTSSSRRRAPRQRCDAALRLARGLGTVSVVGAHFEPDFPLDNGLMFERELTLRVSWATRSTTGSASLDARTGAIDPTPSITHRFRLAEAEEAYRLSTAARRSRSSSRREAERAPARAGLAAPPGRVRWLAFDLRRSDGRRS